MEGRKFLRSKLNSFSWDFVGAMIQGCHVGIGKVQDTEFGVLWIVLARNIFKSNAKQNFGLILLL